MQSNPPLRGKLLRGSLWTIFSRWTLRLTGIINIAILARLLHPSDFGIVAMATAVVGLVDVIFEMGTDTALIAKQDAQREHYDTAWTIKIWQAIIVSGIMVVFAPTVAHYFNKPDVEDILRVLAVSVLLKGMNNIGVVDFRKNLQFHNQFKYLVTNKVMTVPITIIAALILRNYWALIIGIVSGRLIQLIQSYRLHPFRPRISTQSMAEIWNFSKWLLTARIANYLILGFDKFLLGARTTSTELGQYSIANEVSNTPTVEFMAPLSVSLVPGFAKLKSEPRRLDAAFLKTFSASVLIGLPLGVGLSLVAHDLIMVLLGAKWIGAEKLIQVFALHGSCAVLYSCTINVLVIETTGIKSVAWVAIVRAAVFLALLYPMLDLYGLIGIAVVKVLATVIGVIALLYVYLNNTENISVRHIMETLWRPVLGCAVMAAVLHNVDLVSSEGQEFYSLIADIVLGAATYAIVVLLLWIMTGKQKGIEIEFLKIAGKFFSKRQKD